MLTRLSITNYAIITHVTIEFSSNLTIITGETGAGKSILLGALNLIMGSRAETKVLYDMARKCQVEATFAVGSYNLRPFFEENELDYDDEIVILREITPSGKSRAFINDTPVSLPVLRQLTAALLDLHQQFDSLDIHNVSFQLRMIDALAGNKALVGDYERDYRRYTATQSKLTQLRSEAAQASKEMDYWLYLLKELDEANLQTGEKEKLEQELKTLSNAEQIQQTLTQAHYGLTESEQAVIGQVRFVAQQVTTVRSFHTELPALYDRLESVHIELSDIADELEAIATNTEISPERIAEITDRLNVLYKLEQKHQTADTAELLALRDDLTLKTASFADMGESIAALERDLTAQATALHEKAALLSERRHAVTEGFETKIHAMLEQLSMPFARLKVELTPTDALTSTGTDRINFLFAANKGSRMEAIKDVASGGEVARLTLCTKSLVASAIPLPTLIFDEIDTGVSGDVALKMGKILFDLARKHQVVSITHTPQIAAQADAHYFVYKQNDDERTSTSVKLLTEEERVQEIAVMLSGNPPSNAALYNASELLKRSENG